MTLVLSVYTLVNFGFYVAMNSISPVFLQKPVIAGGYGFNTMQNAECKSTASQSNKSDISLQSHSSTGSGSSLLWCTANAYLIVFPFTFAHISDAVSGNQNTVSTHYGFHLSLIQSDLASGAQDCNIIYHGLCLQLLKYLSHLGV